METILVVALFTSTNVQLSHYELPTPQACEQLKKTVMENTHTLANCYPKPEIQL